MNNKLVQRERRHRRVRSKVEGSSSRPRLAVFRSNKFVYAQLIDDVSGKTIASTSDMKVKSSVKKGESFAKVDRATEVGKQIAALAKGLNISSVVFDRGGYRFTGRVKAVAIGAREGGLIF
jgi:large subunit ribosomal protein L18